MKEQVILQIMQHLTMMDKVISSTIIINHHAISDDINKVISEIENRERLLNIVQQLQTRIEEKISELIPSDISISYMDILKCWNNEINIWIEKTNEIDQNTTEILENQKEETTKEISTIFKIQEKFKGYNLADLKK